MTGDTADFTISARTLVVTPDDSQSKVYGGADPALTYTHGTLYNGDTDAVFTGALSRTAGENVGTYPIHLGDAVGRTELRDQLHDRQDLRDHQGHLVGQRRPGVQDLRRRRPGVHLHLQRVPVLRRRHELGITGAADCSRTSGENVLGSPYTITCAPGDLDAANYTFVTGDTADFTISARTLVVTPDDNQSKVYGGSDPALTYTHGTLYNGDDDSVFTGALSRTAGENVGTYPIHLGDLSAGPNYAISFTTGKTFEITKATLSVNADPTSKTYGDADPAFTYTFSGFQFSDNASNSGSPGCGLLADLGQTSWARPTRSPDSLLGVHCGRGWTQPFCDPELHEQHRSWVGDCELHLRWRRESLRQLRIEDLPDPLQQRAVFGLARSGCAPADTKPRCREHNEKRLQEGQHGSRQVPGLRILLDTRSAPRGCDILRIGEEAQRDGFGRTCDRRHRLHDA